MNHTSESGSSGCLRTSRLHNSGSSSLRFLTSAPSSCPKRSSISFAVIHFLMPRLVVLWRSLTCSKKVDLDQFPEHVAQASYSTLFNDLPQHFILKHYKYNKNKLHDTRESNICFDTCNWSVDLFFVGEAKQFFKLLPVASRAIVLISGGAVGPECM